MSDELRIFLRDINGEVVAAWREAFAGVDPVEVSQGDIFDLSADAIVSPANSFGYMDGGIDGVYSMHFGWDLSARLREVLRRDWDRELPVGCAVLIETGDARIPYLVSAPTMRVPMNVSDTVNAYLAFRAALIAVREHNRLGPDVPIRSMLCPGLATFYGCMDPRRSARQMLHAYRLVVHDEPMHGRAHDVLRHHRDMTHDD